MNANIYKQKELQAFRFIRDNIIHGLGSPSVRDIMKELDYASPQSAVFVISSLITKGVLKRTAKGELQILKDIVSGKESVHTKDVPLVGTAPCGKPLLAEENIEAWIPVDTRKASPGHKYFLLHAIGRSMDKKGINDGDLVLVRQQATADEGQVVVALINDEATIKEFRKRGDAVALMPHSTDPDEQQPILVFEDLQIQGVVVASIPSPL